MILLAGRQGSQLTMLSLPPSPPPLAPTNQCFWFYYTDSFLNGKSCSDKDVRWDWKYIYDFHPDSCYKNFVGSKVNFNFPYKAWAMMPTCNNNHQAYWDLNYSTDI